MSSGDNLNIHVLLSKISNFIYAVPAKESDSVDWGSLSKQGEEARASLAKLYRVLAKPADVAARGEEIAAVDTSRSSFDAPPEQCIGGKPWL